MAFSKTKLAVRFAISGGGGIGSADATTTIMTANPPTVDADGVDFSTITVQAKDSQGSNLIVGGDAVALFQDGSAILSSVTDNNNGTYTATITNTTIEPVIVTGTINLANITDTVDNLTFVAEATLLTASRVSGVAPLSVHFEDDAAMVDSTLLSSPFSDIGYFFDFDDTGAGVWDTNGLSRNSAIGPLSTHVFETPGDYTVTITAYNLSGVLYTKTVDIEVTDPEVVYAGTLTTCITSTAHADFTGAPSGCIQITDDDIDVATQTIGAGERLLFAQGAEWTVSSDPNWIESAGPVSIASFGSGAKPKINMGTGTVFMYINDKQDWRLYDLELSNPAKDALAIISGGVNMQRLTVLNITSDGFSSPFGWSHFNELPLLPIDQMVIANCTALDFSDYGLFAGGERCAFLGNTFANSDVTHVTRVWQLYKGTYQHNDVSGSSLTNTNARHAIKLHGPKESELENPLTQGNGNLRFRTKFAIISNNLIGSSGSVPVSIGPQDALSDERLSDIIIDSNIAIVEYGETSTTLTQFSFDMHGQYFTVRNNIADGTGTGFTYNGFEISQRGAEPVPVGCKLFNNLVYRDDNTAGNPRRGYVIGVGCEDTQVINNIACWNGDTLGSVLIADSGTRTVESNNSLVNKTEFVDPANVAPLSRDYHLTIGASSIGAGIDTNAFKDKDNLSRVSGSYDLGAYKNV